MFSICLFFVHCLLFTHSTSRLDRISSLDKISTIETSTLQKLSGFWINDPNHDSTLSSLKYVFIYPTTGKLWNSLCILTVIQSFSHSLVPYTALEYTIVVKYSCFTKMTAKNLKGILACPIRTTGGRGWHDNMTSRLKTAHFALLFSSLTMGGKAKGYVISSSV